MELGSFQFITRILVAYAFVKLPYSKSVWYLPYLSFLVAPVSIFFQNIVSVVTGRNKMNCCTSSKNKKSIAPHNPFLSKNPTPISPANALSAIEQVFYRYSPDRPQVIMGNRIEIRVPLQLPTFRIRRVIDIIKLAASRHHRLCSFVDPDTMTTRLLAETASNVPLSIQIYPNLEPTTWNTIYDKDLNTNFDTTQKKPLWRMSLVVPPEILVEQLDEFVENEDQKQALLSACQEAIQKQQSSLSSSHESASDSQTPHKTLHFLTTVHHCIGDGLSMYIFKRSIVSMLNQENFLAADLELDKVLVNTEPPPLLDNLIDPNFIQIMPVAFGMVTHHFFKRQGQRIRSRLDPPHASEHIELQSHTVNRDTIAKSDPSTLATKNIIPGMPGDVNIIVDVPRPLKVVFSSHTRSHFLWFDVATTTLLRKKCKAQGTTMTAAVLVSALAAVRRVLASQEEYKNEPLPERQGWVLTSSMRHMLPNSQLLYGADKETDPSVSEFGGYGGSIMDPGFRLVDSQRYWERCRRLKRDLASAHRTAFHRLRLINYCYRHPKLWEFIKRNTDLPSLTRSFSVELANLGAWKNPAAPFDADPQDPRFRLCGYGGTLNSSFDGARGLFMLAALTVGDAMNIGVAYDSKAMDEAGAQLFMTVLKESLIRVAQSQDRSISILQASTLDSP